MWLHYASLVQRTRYHIAPSRARDFAVLICAAAHHTQSKTEAYKSKIERAGMWQQAAVAAGMDWATVYTYRLFSSWFSSWLLPFTASAVAHRGSIFAVLCKHKEENKEEQKSQSSRRDRMKWFIMSNNIITVWHFMFYSTKFYFTYQVS